MKRYFFLFTIACLVPFFVQSQDLTDALRYSDVQVQGTARSGAMGNAFGALGGDFTSISINPAGIGLYRSGEFAITPKSRSTSTEGHYYGTKTEDDSYKFSLSNLSYVSVVPSAKQSEAGIISVNFGIGFNRLKDFKSDAFYQGSNVNGSYMDYIVDRANANGYDHVNLDNNPPNADYYERLAWNSDLLLYDNNNNEYWSDMQDAGYGQSQRKSISKDGSIDEYSFAMGLNFNYKFYVGASYSILDLYYRESTTISEWDEQNNIPYFNSFDFNSFLRTSGTGQNFKVGVIYKPINEIRLGVSLHTPTFYRLHDVFNTSMQSALTYSDGPGQYDEKSPYNEYDYKLETPMKAVFSGAFIIAKKGLVSLDYELINYTKANLRQGGDGYDFLTENMDIDKAYHTVGNVRLGGEYRVNDVFSLRAGYQYQPSAFKSVAFNNSQPNSDANLMVYSAGFGYRSGPYTFDLAYRYSTINNHDLPYPNPSDAYPAPAVAKINSKKNDIMFTLGYRF